MCQRLGSNKHAGLRTFGDSQHLELVLEDGVLGARAGDALLGRDCLELAALVPRVRLCGTHSEVIRAI